MKSGNWALDTIEGSRDVGIERIVQISSLWDGRFQDDRILQTKKFRDETFTAGFNLS